MKNEGRTIQFMIILFWVLFWLLNSIDKFINTPMFLWKGKDRITQLQNYFSSIGIQNESISMGFLILITIAEIIAFVYLAVALWHFYKKNTKKMDQCFFMGTISGMAIFTFFTIGDQIFGDRLELLEHDNYWTFLLVSLVVYHYFPTAKKPKSN